jgi:predicted DNA-binding transcriptional regulator AlpA
MQSTQNQIWTPKKAAEWLGLSESTLAKQRLSGSGPVYIKLGARRVGYRETDLEEWVQSNRCRSTSDYAG